MKLTKQLKWIVPNASERMVLSGGKEHTPHAPLSQTVLHRAVPAASNPT